MIKIFDWADISACLENYDIGVLYEDAQIAPETKSVAYLSNRVKHITEVYADKLRRYIFEEAYKRLMNDLKKFEYAPLINDIKNTVHSYNLYE